MTKISVPLLNKERVNVANIEFWTERGYKKNGGGNLPVFYQVAVHGGIERPDVVLSFVVSDWWPECSEVNIKAQVSPRGTLAGQPITFDELPPAGLSVEKWANLSVAVLNDCLKKELIVENEAVVGEEVSVSLVNVPYVLGSDWGGDIRAGDKSNNVEMTTDRLNRVAVAYNAAPARGLLAVADTFQVSRSTAARYVKQAREAGMIEDRRRNKTS